VLDTHGLNKLSEMFRNIWHRPVNHLIVGQKLVQT
jgi:hypothetical protein